MCFFHASDIFKKFYFYMVSCGYFLCDQHYSVKSQGNRTPIFFYIIDGQLELEYEGETYTAKANDVVLLNCHKPHHYYCKDSCEFLFFHFDGITAPDLVDHLIASHGSPVFSLKNAREIYTTINEPIMKLCYQEQDSEASLSSIVYSTLCMIPATDANTGLFIPSHVELSEDTVSYKVIEYVDKHIDQNFTVQQLADFVNLSRDYFARLFKKETGYSPLEYVAIAKINYAKLMLRTTTLSITEIAEFLGYSSPASFINAFRMRRGTSPNKYRNSR